MANDTRSDALQTVYGALVGGLVSSFIGVALYTVFVNTSDLTNYAGPPVAMAMIGLLCSLALMVAGMLLSDRFSWLGTAALFASGFTALWSVTLSFGLQERWLTLLALGVATAVGVGLGWWKFGRGGPASEPVTPSDHDASTTRAVVDE
jgi:FtsH-binding integral membrane protein